MDEYHVDPAVTRLPGLHVHESSVTRQEGVLYLLVDSDDGQRWLAVIAPAGSPQLADFDGTPSASGEHTLLLGPPSPENAEALRNRLAWLRPTIQGLRTGVGLGDRLGLATPGHLRAVRAAGGHLVPFPAQQSIREMSRTGRTPQQVMDDATWGVFAEGWRAGFGADADHLKTPENIDRCLAAGYTFYTFDPGEHVDSAAEHIPPDALRTRFDNLPWEQLEDSPAALAARYLSTPVSCEEHVIHFDELTLMRAAVKYGRAVSHVAMLYRHLAQAGAGRDWEVEVSVDETETPTTHAEHVYIATELRRLGAHWVSLAPRYVGRFEKGVDYTGDVNAFEADMGVHAAIARTLGPYKLSLHSGSDKFSIYEADRASYHVSARLDRAPAPASLHDAALPTLLEQFDAREILHVTFGSVLTARDADGQRLFYDRLMEVLRAHPEAYAADLQAHFLRHLQPFAPWGNR